MPAPSDINAAFEAWLEASEPCEDATGAPDDLRYRRIGHTTAAIEQESDYLVLCRIATDTGARGQGSATRLLDLLRSICDRYNVTLLGQATAYDDSGLDQEALLAWYANHGFQIDRDRTAQPLVWYPRRPE